jgi:hypothetical protein
METVGIATQNEFVFRMRQVYVDVSVVPQPPHTVSKEPYLGAVSGGGLGQDQAGPQHRAGTVRTPLAPVEMQTARAALPARPRHGPAGRRTARPREPEARGSAEGEAETVPEPEQEQVRGK